MRNRVYRLKLNNFEIRIIIVALNYLRMKQKRAGIDNSDISALILRFIDVLET